MNGTKVILDTNIVSYLMKGGPVAEKYAPNLEGRLLTISFITVGEMYYGVEKKRWGKEKREQLETTLQKFAVIPYDHETARSYGRLVAERERKGAPIGLNDAWIAACAVRHRLPLVTHNSKHFENITSLEIITEYE